MADGGGASSEVCLIHVLPSHVHVSSVVSLKDSLAPPKRTSWPDVSS